MTSLTPIEVVSSFNEAWAANDIDAAMACVAEDAVYALYISGELLPAGGETVGRDNIAAALRKIRECFDPRRADRRTASLTAANPFAA